MDEILRMAYNEANFQLKMILSSEFPCTKFLLLIDHSQKPRNFILQKFPAIRHFSANSKGYISLGSTISTYTVKIGVSR